MLLLPLLDTSRLISSLLLFDGKSKKGIIFCSDITVSFDGWQFSKVIDILQALICLVKVLVDLKSFLYLRHGHNLDSVASMVYCKQG